MKIKDLGYEVIEQIYKDLEVKAMIDLLNQPHTTSDNYRVSKDLFAIRNLLEEILDLQGFIANNNFNKLLKSIFPQQNPFLVKAIYFDKPAHSNWSVYWHQDVTISVEKRLNIKGFSAWTYKNGINTVIPPSHFLENIFTFRIHLDDCDEQNGGLKVIPHSHLNGILSDEKMTEIRQKQTFEYCRVKKGGILLMKPLIMHASGKSITNQARRVIHLEFSADELPENLQWKEKCQF